MVKILSNQKEKLIKGIHLKDDIISKLLEEIENKHEEVL